MKNFNKCAKRDRGAGIDIWESRYVVGGREMRKNGKRDSKRARRRSKRDLINEQL
jgi:hypothetical protein